jgi:hypothetical protein
MRLLIFLGTVVLGALIGSMAGLHEDLLVRVVLSLIGALVGCAAGGAIVRLGSGRKPDLNACGELLGVGITSEDLAANYWRDRGHPPFMKPPDEDPAARHHPD